MQNEQQNHDPGAAEQYGQKALLSAFQKLNSVGVEIIIDFGFFQDLLYIFIGSFHVGHPLVFPCFILH